MKSAPTYTYVSAKHRSRFSKHRMLGVLSLIFLTVAGCNTTPGEPHERGLKNDVDNENIARPQDRTHFDQIEAFYHAEKANLETVIDRAHVVIEGSDLMLPGTLPSGQAGSASYLFHVWVHHPGRVEASAEDMLADGTLSIEVIGARAQLRPPSSLANGTVTLSSRQSEAYRSRKVVEIEIRSEDISRPFTILAWFPGEYNSAATERDRSQWAARRDVRVYNGDIRTRVQMVSEPEARASFGDTFPNYFHVGRVRFENRSSEKALLVHTTSMQVPVLLYRRSSLKESSVLPPALRRRLRQEAEREYWSNASFEPQPTASTSSTTGGEAKLQTQSSWNQDSAATAIFTRVYSALFPTPPSPQLLVAGKIVILETWWQQTVIEENAQRTGGYDRLSTNQRLAMAEAMSRKPSKDWQMDTADSTADSIFDNDAFIKRPRVRHRLSASSQIDTARRSEARQIGRAVAESLRRYERETKVKLEGATAAQNTAITTFANLTAKTPESQNERFKKIQDQWEALRCAATRHEIETTGALLLNTCTEIPDDFPELRQGLTAITENLQTVRLALWTAQEKLNALENGKPPDDVGVATAHAQRLDALELAAVSSGNESGTPFDVARGVLVNPAGNALAHSYDASRQRMILEDGYLWRDLYRPMTFQAVLNSVMFTDERSRGNHVLAILDSLATLAGGAIGLSSLNDEFGRSGYAQGVAFFSSVVMPVARKQLESDLKKHIRNMGVLSMDTVVVIPPNESIDRYIFFPKGPIYNYPDEYDPVTPGYLTRVEGEEVSVRATIVDRSYQIRGGNLNADTLTQRALNEGRATELERDRRTAEIVDSARRLEISNLASDIDRQLSATPKLDASGKSNPQRAIVLAELRSRAQTLTQRTGGDPAGMLSGAFARNGEELSDTAPSVIDAGVGLKLLPKVPSNSYVLFVHDDRTHGIDFTVKVSPPEGQAVEHTVTKGSLGAPDPGKLPLVITYTGDVTEVSSKPLLLTLTDAGGKATGEKPVEIPIEVRPPVLKLEDISNGDFKDNQDNTYTYTLSETTAARLRVTLPVHDSTTADWTLTIDGDAKAAVSAVPPATPQADQKQVLWEFIIDPAPLFADTPKNKIEIKVKHSSGTTATASIVLENKPKS